MNEVIVFGGSGYSGVEALRLLAWHPKVRVVGASSDRWAGRAVREVVAGWRGDLRFTPHDALLSAIRAEQVALLATPAKTSVELAPQLLDAGLRVVDLSGAFRLTSAQAYEQWYGFTHPRPDLLTDAQYGLPELIEAPATARLVANPGCYATASIMVLAPLFRAGLVAESAPIVLDGKSGTTGAGRSAKEALLHAEVTENLRAYRVGAHQHTPEIERALQLAAHVDVRVNLTTHLVPMRRGILVSAYISTKSGVTDNDVRAAFSSAYEAQPFVRWVDRPPETAAVRDSNLIEIGATLDTRTGVLCAFGAIDNLVKGAAGQAVQNLNRLLGYLTDLGLFPQGGPT